MGQYYKSLSVAATIMISNKFPIIAKQVVVIFMTSLVTIATALPVKNTLSVNFRKFKVALKPLRRNSFNFAKRCVLTCQSLFNNKKWGSPDSFLSYKHLKGKLRVFLMGKTVAIVTSDVMKMTTTY